MPQLLGHRGENPTEQEAGWASEEVCAFWRREKSLGPAENGTLAW